MQRPAQRTAAVLLAVMMMMVGFSSAALASVRYNKGTPTAVVDTTNGNLSVKFKITGLGSEGQVVASVLEADGTFTVQCFNNGNNAPQGNPFQLGPLPLEDSDEFPAPRNGQITGQLTIEPLLGAVNCGAHTPRLLAVTYTDIVLTHTNAVTDVVLLGPDTLDCDPVSCSATLAQGSSKGKKNK